MNAFHFKVGGCLGAEAQSYVVRKADHDLYQALQNGEFCYVFNARQMGKSSLLVRVKKQLQQEGDQCAYVDMTQLGTTGVTPIQWYRSVVVSLLQSFQILNTFNYQEWLSQYTEMSPIQSLTLLLENILFVRFPGQKIYIFIDEIDSVLSLGFSVDDFFAWIRSCYNRRAHDSRYQKLNFALFGVATPTDLISDIKRTPFNIGYAIQLSGFTHDEAAPLAAALDAVSDQPSVVLDVILNWTSGQPFLTQKVCQLVALVLGQTSKLHPIPHGQEAGWVNQLVETQMIENWENNDEPIHLRTIRDRLLRDEKIRGQLLSTYLNLLQGRTISLDNGPVQAELMLSGLVVRQGQQLAVANLLYRKIFDQDWVNQQLDQLRPYTTALKAWCKSDQKDESRLLRGAALEDALHWSKGKSLSVLDYQFLGASEDLNHHEYRYKLEMDRLKALEKVVKFQWMLLAVSGVALATVIGLGITSYLQYRQARHNEQQALNNEMQAWISSSTALFASGQRLDAIVDALQAQTIRAKLDTLAPALEKRLDLNLREVVFGALESHRWIASNRGVHAIAFSPDGKRIATGGLDGILKIWQLNGQPLFTHTDHEDRIWSLAYSADGMLLASGSADGTVKLRHPNGTLLQTLKGHAWGVWDVSFSPDGSRIASAGLDGTINLWHRDGTLLQSFSEGVAMLAVTFSPDGQTLASGGNDGIIKLRRLDGTFVTSFPPQTTAIQRLAFSPDGQILAAAKDSGSIELWHPDGTLITLLEGHTNVIDDIDFSPEGHTLLSASRDGTINLWHLDGSLLTTLTAHDGEVRGVAFSPDGQTIASASIDNTVRLWRPQGMPFLKILRQSTGAVGQAVSADGNHIATGNQDGSIHIWDADGTLLHLLQGHSAEVRGLAFSPDGQMLASASRDKLVKLWDLKGTLLHTLRGHNDKVDAVEFSPDGKFLATAGWDGTLNLWDTQGDLVDRQQVCEQASSLAFSPDGAMVATGCIDGNTVKLWQRSGELLSTLQGHMAAIVAVTFSPDGQMIASASTDRTVKLWDLEGTLLQTLDGHNSAVWDVAFSPEGQRLASASSDEQVNIWQVDGTFLSTLNGHTDSVQQVAFSDNGNNLITSSNDGTTIVWTLDDALDTPKLLQFACGWVEDYLQTEPDPDKSPSICIDQTYTFSPPDY